MFLYRISKIIQFRTLCLLDQIEFITYRITFFFMQYQTLLTVCVFLILLNYYRKITDNILSIGRNTLWEPPNFPGIRATDNISDENVIFVVNKNYYHILDITFFKLMPYIDKKTNWKKYCIIFSKQNLTINSPIKFISFFIFSKMLQNSPSNNLYSTHLFQTSEFI